MNQSASSEDKSLTIESLSDDGNLSESKVKNALQAQEQAQFTVKLASIIETITKRQTVLNQSDFNSQQLNQSFNGVGTLEDANKNQISFLANNNYADYLKITQAGAIIVAPDYAKYVPKDSLVIIVDSPYLAYASATHLFEPNTSVPSELLNNNSAKSKAHLNQSKNSSKIIKNNSDNIHATAVIAESANISTNVVIGPYCVIGENAKIGANTVLRAHITIGDNVVVGEGCLFYPHVNIEHSCQIGNHVRLHAHACIGSEGFGFAPTIDPAADGWERIAQLGRVIIGNNVRVGSQTCIDRGAIGDTVIGDNVIIDNLVQIAHNVKIGAGSAIAGNAGIAGSSKLGKRCMIGGASGITGHLELTDDVSLSSMTLVSKSIKKPGTYASALVAMPVMNWRRAVVRFRKLGKK